jgi:diguanylate cyclase (GGDEF)-like protein
MVTSRFWTRTFGAWLFALLLAMLLPLATPARAADGAAVDFRLAEMETDAAVPLGDILSGRFRSGFNPLTDKGLSVVGAPDKMIWLRLRADPAAVASAGIRYLSLPRQSIQHLRIFSSGATDRAFAETGIGEPPDQTRWPDTFILPLPAATNEGSVTWYVQVQGQGYLNLQPSLLSEQQMQEQAKSARDTYGFLYASLFAIALLAMFRRWSTGERTFRVAEAAFVCLAASVVGNFHLQLTLGGTSLASIPNLPAALWVLTCAPLLWATQQYAGHEKNLPEVASLLDRLGFVFVVIGVGFLFVPLRFLGPLQIASLCLLALTALICGSSLFFDPRHWRWSPILIWLGFIAALLAAPLSMLQLVPPTNLVRHGFQLLLALQLAVYLLLPWIRQALQERAKLKRSVVVEQSAEEKIAHAREWVISSLQAGIESAAEGDMEWIAYRRLMGGLKPVLPQTASAVIAMNYHNEDLLLVEPKSAEPRFQMLLAQRGSLLKNLSRSLAPQQIGIDFDGPEGPLPHVQLAIIPLPIERPGWGALVIERNIDVTYSEEELDLCTEFAALATTAADEAALVMQMKQASEIDAESGVYKKEMIDELMRRANELALKKRKLLSILRVSVDGFESIAADAAPAVIRRLADLIRDEIDYGETIGRFAADEFLVFLAGRSIGEARALAERLCLTVRKQTVPTSEGGTLLVSIGASQLQPGERTPQLMLERATKALAKARQYGGNQVQAIASTTV